MFSGQRFAILAMFFKAELDQDCFRLLIIGGNIMGDMMEPSSSLAHALKYILIYLLTSIASILFTGHSNVLIKL